MAKRNLPTTLFAMSAQEVGKRLGISRQAVNQAQHRALKKLAKNAKFIELLREHARLQEQKHS